MIVEIGAFSLALALALGESPGQGRSVTALSVADNGQGIDAGMRDKIYIPFYTTKRTGSGVGLSLKRQIALVHGGSIQVTDTPGGGATVTLRLR